MTNKKFKLAAMSLALTACVAASPLAANAETGAEATSSTPAVETPAPTAETSGENAPTTNETKQESTGETKQESTDESKKESTDESKKESTGESKQNPADETKPEVAVENKVLAEAPAAKAPVLMLAKAPVAPTTPMEEDTVATITGQDGTTTQYKSFDEAVSKANDGDTIEVVMTVKTKNDVEYLMLRDPKPAGCESRETASGYARLGTVFGYREIGDEEIRLFLCRLHRTSTIRTFSVYELGLGEEGFTRCTVKTFIISFVDISLIVQFFEDFLYLCLVIGVGGTDEFVVGRIHQIPDSLDLGGYVVYEFFWRDPCLFCFQLDLLAMLIGSGLEEYIVALLTFEAGDAVREYDLVGVSDVRLAGCVGNRRGDIIFWSDFFHCFHFSFQIKKLPYSALL